MPAENSRGGSVASVSRSATTSLGWWKAPTRFLPSGRFTPGLAADRAVDHGQQRGRHLDEGDAAQIGRRDEPGEVADDAAAHGDQHRRPGNLLLGKVRQHRRGRLQRFGRLAQGVAEMPAGDALPVQRLEDDPVDGLHLTVENDEARAAETCGSKPRTESRQDPAANDHVIRPRPKIDANLALGRQCGFRHDARLNQNPRQPSTCLHTKNAPITCPKGSRMS